MFGIVSFVFFLKKIGTQNGPKSTFQLELMAFEHQNLKQCFPQDVKNYTCDFGSKFCFAEKEDAHSTVMEGEIVESQKLSIMEKDDQTSKFPSMVTAIKGIPRWG